MEQQPRHAIRLIVRDDDLRRSRLTVLFRLLLALPHLVWMSLWGGAALILSFVVWLAVLIEGRAPRTLHGFLASFVRYSTHVNAYLFLGAGPYPGFTGEAGYPVDVEIAAPARQNRWTAGFRLVLAVPALFLAGTLAGSATAAGGALAGGGAAAVAAFLGWFACLVRGQMPRGLRDLITYAIGYGAQVSGYLLLLTDRYPDSNPSLVEPPAQLPPHPVRLAAADELRRSRLTTLFRLLLALPHFVWLALWLVPALLAVLAAWFAALVLGRVPKPLHRFLAAYVRYASHVVAFVMLVGGPFPGFAGTEGSYPIDVLIDPPARQRRLVTLFRLLLAFPGMLVASALAGLLYVVAFFGWWAALVTGRMPRGLRDAGAIAIRYNAQWYAYVLLVTSRYPYAAPVLEGPQVGAPPQPEGLAA